MIKLYSYIVCILIYIYIYIIEIYMYIIHSSSDLTGLAGSRQAQGTFVEGWNTAFLHEVAAIPWRTGSDHVMMVVDD